MSNFANIEEALARLTEWNLATLEELRDHKSSSKYRIRRQENVCAEALRACRAFLDLEDIRRWKCIRVVEVIEGKREP